MSANAELGEMVAKISGDNSGLLRSLKESQEGVARFGESVKHSLEAVAEAFAAHEVKEWLTGAFEAADKLEMTMVRLEAAMEGGGRNVHKDLDAYKQWAQAVQDQTTVSRESALAMMAQVEAFGIHGKAAEKTVNNAIAMSKAMGGEAEGYLRLTRAMEEGNIHMLKRILRMREDATETEIVARANEMLKKGLNIAQKEAETTGGQISQLTNLYTDLKVEFGKVVDQGVKPFVGWLKQAVEWIKNLSPAAKEAIVVAGAMTVAFIGMIAAVTAAMLVLDVLSGGVLLLAGAIIVGAAALVYWLGGLKGVKEAFEKVRDELEEMVWFAEFGFQRMGEFANLAWTMLKLGFVSAAEDIKFFFSVQFPMLLSKTIDLVGQFASVVPALIKAGISAPELLPILAQGFGAALAGGEFKLPDRAKNALELELAKTGREQMENLAKGWMKFKEEKLKLKEQVLPDEEVKDVDKKALEVGADVGKFLGKGYKAEKFESALAGTAEDISRILEYQDMLRYGREGKGGQNEGPMKEANRIDASADKSAEANAKLERHTELLKDIRDIAKDQAAKNPIKLEPANLHR